MMWARAMRIVGFGLLLHAVGWEATVGVALVAAAEGEIAKIGSHR